MRGSLGKVSAVPGNPIAETQSAVTSATAFPIDSGRAPQRTAPHSLDKVLAVLLWKARADV